MGEQETELSIDNLIATAGQPTGGLVARGNRWARAQRGGTVRLTVPDEKMKPGMTDDCRSAEIAAPRLSACPDEIRTGERKMKR